MQNTKFYAALLVLVIFTGIFSLSPAISSLMNAVVVRSTGQILTGAYARSGSARDIQAAVDRVAGHGGIGNVYIPEGTFNFVEVGETWKTVNVPAGINLFGAPTERDANGQVVEWKTVLVMPYEVPTSGPDDMPVWFQFVLDNDNLYPPFNTFRFSDIKMVGWRFFDQSSTTMYIGISVRTPGIEESALPGFQDFRIDHCNFQDIAGSAISIGLDMPPYNRRGTRGVIDHNVFNNTYGYPGQMDYGSRTLGYGISLRRWASDVWDSDIQNIWGQYTNYTVFIEDNYFSKWRHDISANDGVHVVVRNNIFDGDYGQGVVDGHGSYADSYRPYAVGTRSMEIYNNTFKNPDTTWTSDTWALNIRGGSFIVTNNNVSGYANFINLQNDYGISLVPKCRVNQTYIWSNNLGGADIVGYNDGTVTLNVHYFLREPTIASDGVEYEPYPYPHPLTLEAAP